MPFNLEKARKDGYSDSEIASDLAERYSFNISKARQDGYSDSEIAEELSTYTRELGFESPKEQRVPQWARDNPNLYGLFGVTKEVYEKAGKPVAHGLGMVGGSAVMAPFGPAAQIGGAGAGYATVKKGTDAIDRGIRRIEGNKSEEDVSFGEGAVGTLKDIQEGAFAETVGQGTGKLISGAIEKVSAPYAKETSRSPVNKEFAGEIGVKYTPAEITQSKGLGLFESMMEKSITATDLMKKHSIEKQLKPLMDEAERLSNTGSPPEAINAIGRRIHDKVGEFLQKEELLTDDVLNDMRSQILSRLGTKFSYESLGVAGKELLKLKSQGAMARASAAYDEVSQYLPKGSEYETPSLASMAEKILESKGKLTQQDSKMMGWLNWASKKVKPQVDDATMKELEAYPPHIRDKYIAENPELFGGGPVKRDWETLQEFRKDLNDLIRKEDAAYGSGMAGMKFQSTREAGVYKQLKKALDRDLQAIAESEGGKAWEQFQIANKMYGEYADIYKHDFIRKMVKANPEKLVETAFRPNSTTEIKLLKDAIGPEGFTQLREGFTNRLMGAGQFDVFSPKNLRAQIMKYGDEMLTEVYGKQTLDTFKEIAKDGLKLDVQSPGHQFLKTLARTYPDTVVDAIIGAPEAKLQSHTMVKNLSILRSVAGKDWTKDQLGQQLMEKLFAKDDITGLIKPQTFVKMFDKYGDRVLKILFPAEKVADLKRLADIARPLNTAEKLAGNPSGTGQTIMTFSYMGMILRNPIKGTALVLAPKYMTKIYLSDSGMKWLTEGFKVPANSKRGIELGAKLSSLIAQGEMAEE